MIEALDTGYEDRMIRRITVKQAFASRLDARLRRIMCRRLEGYTLAEIGAQEGVSGAWINELEHKALKKLQSSPDGKTQHFDPTVFLDHMRGLINEREQSKHARFEYECSQLRSMVEIQDDDDAESAAQRKAHEQMQAISDALRAEKAAAGARFRERYGDLDYTSQQQVELACLEWSVISPQYATEFYRKVRISGRTFIDGWWLEDNNEYWLPLSVIDRLTDKLAA